MSIQYLHNQYQLAAERGHIPQALVARATLATILEAGITAFHKAYFGLDQWNTVVSEIQANRKAAEEAGHLQEALLRDISNIRRTLRETQTTSDFPMILAQLRNRVMRQSFNPVESTFWKMATQRTANDFRLLKGYRIGTFNRLPKRPERTDVEYVELTMTEDGYTVANYEMAMGFTWESWVNDDLGAFTIGLANMGVAARRTRGLVIFEAIAAGINQTTPTGGAGGPTIPNLEDIATTLASQTNADSKALALSMSDIAYPAKWATTANSSLNSQFVVGPTTAKTGQANPVYGIATPHLEPMMAEALSSDWLAWDNRFPWLEVAVLRGFEAGPLTYTKLPDVTDHVEQGSFDNHSLSVKVGDAFGCLVTTTTPVLRVKGA